MCAGDSNRRWARWCKNEWQQLLGRAGDLILRCDGLGSKCEAEVRLTNAIGAADLNSRWGQRSGDDGRRVRVEREERAGDLI
jgi:hypothetical protein